MRVMESAWLKNMERLVRCSIFWTGVRLMDSWRKLERFVYSCWVQEYMAMLAVAVSEFLFNLAY